MRRVGAQRFGGVRWLLRIISLGRRASRRQSFRTLIHDGFEYSSRTLTHSAIFTPAPFLPTPSTNIGKCLYPPPLTTPAKRIRARSSFSHVSSFSPRASISVSTSSSACRWADVGHCMISSWPWMEKEVAEWQRQGVPVFWHPDRRAASLVRLVLIVSTYAVVAIPLLQLFDHSQ